jgi:transmembrane 9 superfamily protein 3
MLFMCCRRGAIVTTFIVCYALTSFIAGYVSGGLYSRHGGMHLCPLVS